MTKNLINNNKSELTAARKRNDCTWTCAWGGLLCRECIVKGKDRMATLVDWSYQDCGPECHANALDDRMTKGKIKFDKDRGRFVLNIAVTTKVYNH